MLPKGIYNFKTLGIIHGLKGVSHEKTDEIQDRQNQKTR